MTNLSQIILLLGIILVSKSGGDFIEKETLSLTALGRFSDDNVYASQVEIKAHILILPSVEKQEASVNNFAGFEIAIDTLMATWICKEFNSTDVTKRTSDEKAGFGEAERSLKLFNSSLIEIQDIWDGSPVVVDPNVPLNKSELKPCYAEIDPFGYNDAISAVTFTIKGITDVALGIQKIHLDENFDKTTWDFKKIGSISRLGFLANLNDAFRLARSLLLNAKNEGLKNYAYIDSLQNNRLPIQFLQVLNDLDCIPANQKERTQLSSYARTEGGMLLSIKVTQSGQKLSLNPIIPVSYWIDHEVYEIILPPKGLKFDSSSTRIVEPSHCRQTERDVFCGLIKRLSSCAKTLTRNWDEIGSCGFNATKIEEKPFIAPVTTGTLICPRGDPDLIMATVGLTPITRFPVIVTNHQHLNVFYKNKSISTISPFDSNLLQTTVDYSKYNKEELAKIFYKEKSYYFQVLDEYSQEIAILVSIGTQVIAVFVCIGAYLLRRMKRDTSTPPPARKREAEALITPTAEGNYGHASAPAIELHAMEASRHCSTPNRHAPPRYVDAREEREIRALVTAHSLRHE